MGILSTIKILTVLAIISVLGSGLYYVINLKANLEVERQNVVTLKESVQSQQILIDNLNNNILKIQEINNSMNISVSKLRVDLKNLNDRFNTKSNGQSRDFAGDAIAKPDVVTKVINSATVKANRCIEIATGSPLKDKETNSECQALIDSLSK